MYSASRPGFPKPIFFFNDPATTEIYTLSLHDALPISVLRPQFFQRSRLPRGHASRAHHRSEEHTSELQSQSNLVCRLLLEKKKLMTVPVVGPLLALTYRATVDVHARSTISNAVGSVFG